MEKDLQNLDDMELVARFRMALEEDIAEVCDNIYAEVVYRGLKNNQLVQEALQSYKKRVINNSHDILLSSHNGSKARIESLDEQYQEAFDKQKKFENQERAENNGYYGGPGTASREQEFRTQAAASEYNYYHPRLQADVEENLYTYLLECGGVIDDEIVEIAQYWGISLEDVQKRVEHQIEYLQAHVNDAEVAYDLYSTICRMPLEDVLQKKMGTNKVEYVELALQAIKEAAKMTEDLTLQDTISTEFNTPEGIKKVLYLFRDGSVPSEKDVLIIGDERGTPLSMEKLDKDKSLHQFMLEQGMLTSRDRKQELFRRKNIQFMENLSSPEITLVYVPATEWTEPISEDGKIQLAGTTNYYDLLVQMRNGQYEDVIPVPVFLEKAADYNVDLSRINAYTPATKDSTMTAREHISEVGYKEATPLDIDKLITNLVAEVISDKQNGIPNELPQVYSYLQPLVDQAINNPAGQGIDSEFLENLRYEITRIQIERGIESANNNEGQSLKGTGKKHEKSERTNYSPEDIDELAEAYGESVFTQGGLSRLNKELSVKRRTRGESLGEK